MNAERADDWTRQPARPIAAAILCILLLAALPTAIARSSPRRTTVSPPAPEMRLDINTASRAELMAIPGIGRATANAIIDHRAARGLFPTIESLDAVRGIGPRTIEDLRPFIIALPPSPPSAPPPAP